MLVYNGAGEHEKSRVKTEYEKCNLQGTQALNSFYFARVRTRTHVFIRLLSPEGRLAGGTEPGRVPSRLVRSHRTPTTTVGLKPTYRNPRAHDPGCSATTTTRSHCKGQQTADLCTKDRSLRPSHHDRPKAIGHDDCSTLVLTTTLLFLFSGHSPPDWMRGCRATSGLPSLVGPNTPSG